MSSRLKRSAIGVILTISLASNVWAAPPKHLPEGTRTNNAWCFDLDESKDLLILDKSYDTCLGNSEKKDRQIKLFDKLVENTRAAVKIAESSVDVLNERNKNLYKMWKEENLKRHEAENKPNFGAWIGWGAAAVMAGVAASLAVVLAVKE